MKYPKNITLPPHHPHELARRQSICRDRIRHHTEMAVANGLLGFACLGILFNYVQKDFAQKNDALIPLMAAQTSALTLSITATSLLKRKKWIQVSQRMKNY